MCFPSEMKQEGVFIVKHNTAYSRYGRICHILETIANRPI